MCAHAEPSPEEKLQKLHTDIKFALKVDNPVSDLCDFCQHTFISFCSWVEQDLFLYVYS